MKTNKNKKPKKVIGLNLANVTNAAATGAALGGAGSAIAGGSKRANIIGAVSGLGIGTGSGIVSQKLKNKHN